MKRWIVRISVGLSVVVICGVLIGRRVSEPARTDAPAPSIKHSSSVRVVAKSSAPAETHSSVEQSSADSTPPTKPRRRFTDGVAAVQSIDWSTVRIASPMPQVLPTQRAADAIDAGFAPEWFERSIGRGQAESLLYKGKSAYVSVQDLASKIMSQSKSPDDYWANGMEDELTALTTSESRKTPILTRVFCSGGGCLLYVESESEPISGNPGVEVLGSLVRDPMWRDAYGVQPLTYYMTGIGSWDLILIARPRCAQANPC